jgi:thiol:disulfide interchange protein
MIHTLLVLAAIVFVVWLLIHAFSALSGLLWIAILVAVGYWVYHMLTRRRSRTL